MAFEILEKNRNGCISASDLRCFLTSLGYNMTECEIMDMMNIIGKCTYSYDVPSYRTTIKYLDIAFWFMHTSYKQMQIPKDDKEPNHLYILECKHN